MEEDDQTQYEGLLLQSAGLLPTPADIITAYLESFSVHADRGECVGLGPVG